MKTGSERSTLGDRPPSAGGGRSPSPMPVPTTAVWGSRPVCSTNTQDRGRKSAPGVKQSPTVFTNDVLGSKPVCSNTKTWWHRDTECAESPTIKTWLFTLWAVLDWPSTCQAKQNLDRGRGRALPSAWHTGHDIKGNRHNRATTEHPPASTKDQLHHSATTKTRVALNTKADNN